MADERAAEPICTLPRGCLRASEPRGLPREVFLLPELRVLECIDDVVKSALGGASREDEGISGLVARGEGLDAVLKPEPKPGARLKRRLWRDTFSLSSLFQSLRV